ncbi:MAG: DUF378 domain-containing protein [Alphaproteobacteria bacterium]|nr:DUF378 domain-containing protein [Alphaproteobacteria bacterium]
MILNKTALLLTIIGGINWGLVGVFGFDLVKFCFSFLPILITVVQILVGISALYVLYAYMFK